jgi:demethylmenaquinone methyltransferase/2-methoxy-6-polyprenyl-1,4-benzoquinol methylase
VNNKKEIIKFFDKNAHNWDFKEKTRTYKILEKIIKRIKLKSYENVLDLGCGTGICYPYLKEKFNNYIGVDISPKMIEIAKRKFPKAKFMNKDFEETKLKKNFFDLVLIFNAFPHFDKTKTVRKVRSILKKRGKLVIAHSFKLNEINKIHKKTEHKIIKKHILTVKEIKKLLKSFGFKNILYDNKRHFYIEAEK